MSEVGVDLTNIGLEPCASKSTVVQLDPVSVGKTNAAG